MRDMLGCPCFGVNPIGAQTTAEHSSNASTNDVPAIDDAATAFGVAYVLEGSRLGGQVVSRVLAKRLALTKR